MENEEAISLVNICEKALKSQFEKIDSVALTNTKKILDAFKKANVTLSNMACSSGYGYEDTAKPKLCSLYKEIFKSEDAIVCPQITCGTHALTLPLFGILRPGDSMLSITGKPYDTMDDIINGVENKDIGSLKDFNISYSFIEMKGDKIDVAKCLKTIEILKPKLIYIQRSRGYSTREALSVYYIKDVIKKIREIDNKTVIMVDNCYGEFTEDIEPIEAGADICAGSLMKNAGGGIAPTGGYIVGRKDLVELSSGRLTSPTLGIEVGSYNASYYPFFEGIFVAPHVVACALKGNILLGKVLSKLGINSTPKVGFIPHDTVRSIMFNDKDKLISFCQLVQSLSPIDSNVTPIPWLMPGYKDEVIMAAGTFIQGSTMELSCDGPIRPPYICYIQGGLTYEHVKILAIETAKLLSNS